MACTDYVPGSVRLHDNVDSKPSRSRSQLCMQDRLPVAIPNRETGRLIAQHRSVHVAVDLDASYADELPCGVFAVFILHWRRVGVSVLPAGRRQFDFDTPGVVYEVGPSSHSLELARDGYGLERHRRNGATFGELGSGDERENKGEASRHSAQCPLHSSTSAPAGAFRAYLGLDARAEQRPGLRQ